MKIAKNRLVMIKEKEMEYDYLKSTESVYNFLKYKVELHKEPEEVVVMLALDNKLNVVSYCDVARGDISQSFLNPREIFKRALVSNAKSIIIAHNHPSGDVTPSLEDSTVTKIIKEAGEIMGIKLLDHVIVGEKEYYSFFENDPEMIDSYEATRHFRITEKKNKNKTDKEVSQKEKERN
ncbi:MAG: DNA repair protein RadC [Firmicutes bacterium]|nr:DNA repair protein RadC [Bacillota bacterium]